MPHKSNTHNDENALSTQEACAVNKIREGKGDFNTIYVNNEYVSNEKSASRTTAIPRLYSLG